MLNELHKKQQNFIYLFFLAIETDKICTLATKHNDLGQAK